ncbi:C2H2-type domain-containing protein [Caenorhabditis elegans]|uniref:C2H2-type domain-containing protein n=1 Tax=Caenorhabditis elegans TaxID=6239 RepID=V6CIV2_CAEEL|nr:C2H2-type domain-containing protein [Caenorhabditis elegans]CDK13372.1 C2H2-type domain-containing protein [Caenorhabditis elegans]|eukprot:NP_001293705.1 Uncharacterized protein CELE_C01G5.7 [Caenorhabditis elegans]
MAEEEYQATATAIAITTNLPNWALLDEISVPLLETGVGTLPLLQAALPSILSISQNDDKVKERYRKVLRIAQLQIEHLLKSQQELLKHMEKLESENISRILKPKNMKMERKTSGGSPENNDKYKCADCGKIFLNENFLTSHFERRHPKPIGRSSSD